MAQKQKDKSYTPAPVYRLRSIPVSARSPGLFWPVDRHSYYSGGCEVCGHGSTVDRRFPAQVEFRGSAPLDIHDAGGVFLAKRSIAFELQNVFPEFEIHEIDIYKKSRTVFPEDYVEIFPKLNVSVFRTDTVVTRVWEDCGHCGWRSMEFRNIEKIETFPDQHGELDFRILRERPANEGVVLRKSDVGPSRVFRFLDGFVFCTNQFKLFVEEKNYSNVVFTEVGILADDVYKDLSALLSNCPMT